MDGELLDKIPKEPPRSLDTLPGLSLRNAVNKSSLLFSATCLGFFTIFILSVVFVEDKEAKLAIRKTITTPGKVVAVEKAKDFDNSAVSTVTYSFQNQGGESFRGTQRVREGSPYSGVREGEEVSVVYLESDPSVSGIAGEIAKGPSPFVFLFLPFFFAILFLPMFVPGITQLIRHRKIFKSGHITQGTVLFVKKRSDLLWPGFPSFSSSEVYVLFATNTGEHVEAVVRCSNDWVLLQLPVGEEVTIAYLSNSPKKAMMLEAYIR